jgi:hypothetical protein
MLELSQPTTTSYILQSPRIALFTTVSTLIGGSLSAPSTVGFISAVLSTCVRFRGDEIQHAMTSHLWNYRVQQNWAWLGINKTLSAQSWVNGNRHLDLQEVLGGAQV